MKVLHVITGLEAGGAETQLAMLVTRSRHDVEVVTLYNAGTIADRIRSAGVPVTDLGMTSNTQVTALARLYRLIRRGRFDVVHAHLYRSQIYARPAARLARTPVVLTTEHSIGETHIERREMTRGVRGLYLSSERFSDGTIAVSEVVEERLVAWGVPRRKIVTIPNGVDVGSLAFDAEARRRTREAFGIPEDAFVIGTLGRLDPNKRVDLLLRAVAPLLTERTWFMVVGRGEELERVQSLARSEGVADRVVFAGFQEDTTSMLCAFDLFVMTSLQETFGLSVLEALGNGLRVLFTTCPALDGIETDRARRVEGELLALREAIREEIESTLTPRSVPHEVFDRYGIDAVARQVDDHYEWLLAQRPASRRRAVSRREAAVGAASEPRTAKVG